MMILYNFEPNTFYCYRNKKNHHIVNWFMLLLIHLVARWLAVVMLNIVDTLSLTTLNDRHVVMCFMFVLLWKKKKKLLLLLLPHKIPYNVYRKFCNTQFGLVQCCICNNMDAIKSINQYMHKIHTHIYMSTYLYTYISWIHKYVIKEQDVGQIISTQIYIIFTV